MQQSVLLVYFPKSNSNKDQGCNDNTRHNTRFTITILSQFFERNVKNKTEIHIVTIC